MEYCRSLRITSKLRNVKNMLMSLLKRGWCVCCIAFDLDLENLICSSESESMQFYSIACATN